MGQDVPYLSGAKKFAEDIVRSPAAGVAGIGSKLAGPLVSKLPSLLRPAATGLAEALPSAAAGQAERVGEGGEFTPKEAALEIGAGVALPVLGQAAKGLGKDIFQGMLKPKAVALRKANTTHNELSDIAEKYGLFGDFEAVVKKATKRLDEVDNQIESVLTSPKAQNATIDIDAVAINLLDEAKNKTDNLRSYLPPGGPEGKDYFEQLESAITSIYKSLDDTKQTGDVAPKTARQIKQWLNTKSFKKGPPSEDSEMHALARELFYLRTMDELAKKVPDIKPLNQEMSELIKMRSFVSEAIPRLSNRDRITNAKGLAGGFLGSQFGPAGSYLGGAIGSIGDRALGRGLGAKLVYGTGELMQKSSALQPLISQIPGDPEERMRRLRQ
jgi:hypothetical protein